MNSGKAKRFPPTFHLITLNAHSNWDLYIDVHVDVVNQRTLIKADRKKKQIIIILFAYI